MKRRARRVKYKVGDVIAIPLPNGTYAYARLYRDHSLGIYDLVTKLRADASELISRPTVFWIGSADFSIKNGDWPIIGHDPFPDIEDAWPPATYVQDIIDPSEYRIYEKGELRDATKEETIGLEPEMLCSPATVVAKLISRLSGGQ